MPKNSDKQSNTLSQKKPTNLPNSNQSYTTIPNSTNYISKNNSKLTNFWLGYNVFLWFGLLIFNLTFSVNWLQAVFYLATSGFLALLLGNIILRRFSTKTLQILILIVFVCANVILTFFKQFEVFWSLYYLTYCLIFVRLFVSLRNRIGQRQFWHQITKRSLRILTSIFLLLTLPFSYFFITDPFNPNNTIIRPYESYQQNGQIGLNKLEKLQAFKNPFSVAVGYLKSGGHILGANFVKEKGFETKSETTNPNLQNQSPANPKSSLKQNITLNQDQELEQIIKQSHDLRFGPKIPYIISGGHFSVFYARSLGIFYHATIDSNLNSNQNDWESRQIAYLKTLAFAMDSFESCGDLYTTVVPLGENSITCLNIYHYPSDTLYSLLFAFSQLLDNSEYLQTYYPVNSQTNSELSNSNPINSQSLSSNLSSFSSVNNSNQSFNSIDAIFNNNSQNSYNSTQKSNQIQIQKNDSKDKLTLQTQTYTKVLLAKYSQTLIKFWQKYREVAFDEKTGLIRLDVELSGTKDIGLQNGSFYDNVIFWKTWQLAQKLELVEKNDFELDNLKQRIISEFWNENLGIFAEDQSTECAKKCYSSDWLIILLTGFLKTTNAKERIYYERSVDFIIKNKIDQPFPLRYHNDDRPDKTYPLVRLTNHEYAGTAIWSYWGLEYIKTLYLLDQKNSNSQNLEKPNSSEKLENLPTNSLNYRQIADQFLVKYQENILKYEGFPEVYDSRGNMMEANLYRSVVKSHIILERTFCVKDFENDYFSYKGNAYGLANTLFQTAVFKPSLESKMENLYFAGQLTVPGPGLPPSLVSGKIVAGEIIKKNRQ